MEYVIVALLPWSGSAALTVTTSTPGGCCSRTATTSCCGSTTTGALSFTSVTVTLTFMRLLRPLAPPSWSLASTITSCQALDSRSNGSLVLSSPVGKNVSVLIRYCRTIYFDGRKQRIFTSLFFCFHLRDFLNFVFRSNVNRYIHKKHNTMKENTFYLDHLTFEFLFLDLLRFERYEHFRFRIAARSKTGASKNVLSSLYYSKLVMLNTSIDPSAQ